MTRAFRGRAVRSMTIIPRVCTWARCATFGAGLAACTSSDPAGGEGALQSSAAPAASSPPGSGSGAATGSLSSVGVPPGSNAPSGGSASSGGSLPSAVPSQGASAPSTAPSASGSVLSSASSSSGQPSATMDPTSGIASSAVASGSAAPSASPPCTPNGHARNPIVSHVFTADPSAEVFNGRVYIYASHDTDTQMGYDMRDYHIFSSSDLVNWQDHGVGLDVKDVPWASSLYAPDAAYSEKTGKYYLYFPNSGASIGVAVSDDPGGPFVDALGKPLITKSTPGVADVDWLFDPTCFIDDDGQAYLYFGGGPSGTGDNARVIRLNDDMVSLKDASATTIPAPQFFEASFMHKRDGKYYFSYSTSGAPKIDYMMSDNPMTGFEYVGTALPNPAGNNGNNNHASILEFHDEWYIFYHTRVLSNRDGFSDYQRSITLDKLTYDAQGKINQVPAQMGVIPQLECVDGFARIEAEAMADQRGIEIEFAMDGNTRTGVNVTELSDQDWIGYSQVNLGAGATKFHARVASNAASPANIEIYVDGCGEFTDVPGELIGTCPVQSTGGAQTWTDIECPVTAPAGPHDVCLRFTGSPGQQLLNLDYFRFE